VWCEIKIGDEKMTLAIIGEDMHRLTIGFSE
jgi:hypothetical protein